MLIIIFSIFFRVRERDRQREIARGRERERYRLRKEPKYRDSENWENDQNNFHSFNLILDWCWASRKMNKVSKVESKFERNFYNFKMTIVRVNS